MDKTYEVIDLKGVVAKQIKGHRLAATGNIIIIYNNADKIVAIIPQQNVVAVSEE